MVTTRNLLWYEERDEEASSKGEDVGYVKKRGGKLTGVGSKTWKQEAPNTKRRSTTGEEESSKVEEVESKHEETSSSQGGKIGS
jgi:hypothetical protein